MILDTKVNPNSLTPGFFVVENGVINKDFALVGRAYQPFMHKDYNYLVTYDDIDDYQIIWQTNNYPTYIVEESSYRFFGRRIDNSVSYENQEDDKSYTYECYDNKFLKIPRNIISMQECGLYTNFHTLSYHYFKETLISDISGFIHIILVELIRLDYDKHKIITIDKSFRPWFGMTGTNNTAIGTNSLLNNVTGSSNTAIGTNSLLNNVTGTSNTVIGIYAI